MSGEHACSRAPPRTTALGALAVFLPLFAVLLWWAFAHRVAPLPSAASFPEFWTLPPFVAIAAVVLAAAGPAVLFALTLANHTRLRRVFRSNRGRVLSALGLALLAPIFVFEWAPINILWLILSNPAFLAVYPFVFVPAYFLACPVVSGVRNRLLRFAIFALVWWSIYGWALLMMGYQVLDLI